MPTSYKQELSALRQTISPFPMEPSTSWSLRQRLLDAEASFLSATDPAALRAFESQWDKLCQDLEDALASQALDDSLQSLAHSICLRVAVLSESFMQLENDVKTLDPLPELEEMLSRMSLDSLDETPDQLPFASPPSPTTYGLGLSSPAPPLCIAPAYQWLLKNIHDPYPSTALKKSLAKQARMSTRAMDNWFKTMRRDTGWVTLCRKHFRGSRSLAISAAKRVFLEEEGSSTIPFELATDLLSIKRRLKNRYYVESEVNQMKQTQISTIPNSSSQAPPLNIACISSSDDEPEIWSVSSLKPATPSTSPSRPPSLVFSLSDSDEEDRLPEYPVRDFLDDAGVWSAHEHPCAKFPGDAWGYSLDPVDTKAAVLSFEREMHAPQSQPELLSPILSSASCPRASSSACSAQTTPSTSLSSRHSTSVLRKRRRSDGGECLVAKRMKQGITAGGQKVVSNPLPRTNTSEVPDSTSLDIVPINFIKSPDTPSHNIPTPFNETQVCSLSHTPTIVAARVSASPVDTPSNEQSEDPMRVLPLPSSSSTFTSTLLPDDSTAMLKEIEDMLLGHSFPLPSSASLPPWFDLELPPTHLQTGPYGGTSTPDIKNTTFVGPLDGISVQGSVSPLAGDWSDDMFAFMCGSLAAGSFD